MRRDWRMMAQVSCVVIYQSGLIGMFNPPLIRRINYGNEE